jgi:hypothetical protein
MVIHEIFNQPDEEAGLVPAAPGQQQINRYQQKHTVGDNREAEYEKVIDEKSSKGRNRLQQ